MLSAPQGFLCRVFKLWHLLTNNMNVISTVKDKIIKEAVFLGEIYCVTCLNNAVNLLIV